jgi:hypothetical protein
MAAFLYAVILLAAALTLHVCWWRWRLPRHHTAALLLVFALPPCIAGAAWLFAGPPFGLVPADLPGLGLCYLGAAGSYLITYAGVEETSPSLLVIRALEQAGPRGCSHEELAKQVTEERFVLPRIAALKRDRLVVVTEAGGTLTPAGRRVARLATVLARIFNLHEGI